MTNFKKLREKAGLTQKEVADAMQVSEIAVRKWEKGDRTPRTKAIRPLAQVLGCRPEQLL